MSETRLSFEDWLLNAQWSRITFAQHHERRGQWLMNTAPEHIYKRATGDIILDCFYNDDRIDNFITFAKLCWDEHDPTQMDLARTLISQS